MNQTDLEKAFDKNSDPISVFEGNYAIDRDTFVKVITELLPKWVSVEERLPEKEEYVFVISESTDNPDLCYLDGWGRFLDSEFQQVKATHWIHPSEIKLP